MNLRSIYRFLRSLGRKLLRKLGWRRLYYAEQGADRYVREKFFPDFHFRGVVLEVGCATPELISMSKHFRDCGWRSIGIEPNPEFVKLQRSAGNEVYEYAAADFEADDQPFEVVMLAPDYAGNRISAHSYSSLKIKDRYAEFNNGEVQDLPRRTIRVSVRKLDTILREHCPEVDRVDILSVDVEGYELEVLRGFDLNKYKPRVVVLENLFHDPEYDRYMEGAGYIQQKRLSYDYIYTRIAD